MTEIDATDYEYRRQEDYCQHGTYTGNAYGPDYMCHYCESGISMDELRRQWAEEKLALVQRAWRVYGQMAAYRPFSAAFTTYTIEWLVDWLESCNITVDDLYPEEHTCAAKGCPRRFSPFTPEQTMCLPCIELL